MPRGQQPKDKPRSARRRRWSAGGRVMFDQGPPRFFVPTGCVDDETTGRLSYAGAALDDASTEELNAVAKALRIGDYETMNRRELVQEIRDRL